mmetsp:Transcript_19665/g.27451  ORF Transcript_19665/g.27451 Transcript_19665/m.27451 type:complete len:113 (-) Transcript_19665:424-762(-)
MLSCQVQSLPSEQLFEGIIAQAIKATKNPPRDQNTESKTMRRPLSSLGVNSTNIAPSTGRLPPTPVPRKKYKTIKSAKFGDAAALRPKAPASNRVELNANFLPVVSDQRPQK